MPKILSKDKKSYKLKQIFDMINCEIFQHSKNKTFLLNLSLWLNFEELMKSPFH